MLLALGSTGSRRSASTNSRTSLYVGSASTISPLGGLLETAAVLAVSPATKLRPGSIPRPATVPVLIPVRVASTTP